MFLSLAALTLAVAPEAPETEWLSCMGSFYDEGRHGIVNLLADGDHRPLSLTISILEPDHWSRADLTLDPRERRLPGLFSGAFFSVRFTRRPVFPLKVEGYADGKLRWRREITTPFWPSSLDGTDPAESDPGAASDPARVPGTVDYVSRADDGLPVPTPRELKIVLIDARGLQVGERRYSYMGSEVERSLATSLADVESRIRARACRPPPPPID